MPVYVDGLSHASAFILLPSFPQSENSCELGTCYHAMSSWPKSWENMGPLILMRLTSEGE